MLILKLLVTRWLRSKAYDAIKDQINITSEDVLTVNIDSLFISRYFINLLESQILLTLFLYYKALTVSTVIVFRMFAFNSQFK